PDGGGSGSCPLQGKSLSAAAASTAGQPGFVLSSDAGSVLAASDPPRSVRGDRVAIRRRGSREERPGGGRSLSHSRPSGYRRFRWGTPAPGGRSSADSAAPLLAGGRTVQRNRAA